MADLISREAALDILKFKPIDDGGVVDDCIMQVLALAKSKVSKLPSVDAVEVVRCGSPCHWLYDGPGDYCCTNHKGLVKITPDSFCSYGKRREENAGKAD